VLKSQGVSSADHRGQAGHATRHDRLAQNRQNFTSREKVSGMISAALRQFEPGTRISIVEGEGVAIAHSLLPADKNMPHRGPDCKKA